MVDIATPITVAAVDDSLPAKIWPGQALTCRGLQRRFGNRLVLDGIDLDLRPGEAVAIVGRSGCGKSTLLRLLAGLDAPDGGRIAIDDAALVGLNRAARVMFQDASLYPWKRLADNAALGLHGPDRLRGARALERVGLGGRARDWPRQLSGGQRQRVSLARALASQPRLLLLDEPLGALDALTRSDMQCLITTLWRQHGFTLVLVTHDVEEALVLADRVLVMDEGRWTASVPVDLPRPRDPTDAAFTALRRRLHAAICHQPACPDLAPAR